MKWLADVAPRRKVNAHVVCNCVCGIGNGPQTIERCGGSGLRSVLLCHAHRDGSVPFALCHCCAGLCFCPRCYLQNRAQQHCGAISSCFWLRRATFALRLGGPTFGRGTDTHTERERERERQAHTSAPPTGCHWHTCGGGLFACVATLQRCCHRRRRRVCVAVLFGTQIRIRAHNTYKFYPSFIFFQKQLSLSYPRCFD